MTVLVDRAGLVAFGTDGAADVRAVHLDVLDALAAVDPVGTHAALATVLHDLRDALDRLEQLLAWPVELAAAFTRLDDTMAGDRRLAGLLDHLGNRTSTQGALAAVLVDLAPAGVARLWADLPPADRAWLQRRHGHRLAGLDGIPVAVRDRLNRATIRARIASLRDRLDDLEVIPGRRHGPQDGPPLVPDPARIDVEADIARLQPLLGADHVLAFDPRGDGRAVVALGNPSTARHVATMVPGIGTTLASTPRLLAEAARLRQEARAHDDDVATIAWLGYDTPPGLVEVGVGLAARDITPLLAASTRVVAERDQQALVDHAAGIRARNPAVHHTVVGHSYGSVLALRALAPGGTDTQLDVDDLVALGSPGPGRDVEDIEDLAVPPGVGVWTASSWGDPVPWLPWLLGPRLTELGNGVHRLPTDRRNVGHGSYFAAGSIGLAATATVVAGRSTRPSSRKPLPSGSSRPRWVSPTR